MQPSNTEHNCTDCGFTFTGGRVQIIDGKAYCYNDAPTTEAQRNNRAYLAILNNR
ncbi:hypothetical protein ACIBEF_00435 [Micromonospora sp. NPDC050795]|uniref:hypothetical protein n=1 Tax=Micromonospora sp. NPDC050795 TaxID=3364282 RepID=UPI0037B96185